MTTRKTDRTAKTIQLPDTWKTNFRAMAMRTSFSLSLSQTMLEFLCAVADGVQWDRGFYGVDIHRPDNWIASEAALTKRGLIVRKCREEMPFRERCPTNEDLRRQEHNYCKLTPAGESVVQLLKVGGIFVEADAAINKRSRGRA